MVCSGVLEVPFGPECFGGGNFAGEGATTMFLFKKAVRPRTKLQKHDIQDTRVTVESKCSLSKERKGRRLKKLRQMVEAFLIRQALLEIWEHRLEYWEYASEAVGTLLEVIFS